MVLLQQIWIKARRVVKAKSERRIVSVDGGESVEGDSNKH